MVTENSPVVLVVHPVLGAAQRYAEDLGAFGFIGLASDRLAPDYDHQPIHALVLCDTVHWWIDASDERAMPPTVLVGGDALGLVRAAGACKCPAGASSAQVAHSLRSLIRLSRHSRGRGTMPMRISCSPCMVKVGRWMTVVQYGAFDDDLDTSARRTRPLA
jgi:hypothetical protein